VHALTRRKVNDKVRSACFRSIFVGRSARVVSLSLPPSPPARPRQCEVEELGDDEAVAAAAEADMGGLDVPVGDGEARQGALMEVRARARHLGT
jgi:hypothetical protein